ncbi:AGE family epimerase/isomerase [Bosea minatitlanensis]|uniref:AGE family epimerase/isomerase n=1 Tax=Bosea minatitlanensis TaxID=128782 RepID=A0ABW0F422_9HYPH|nr:AGE family epimerase/isomerase [Bosea minatitlanensis]MCT4493911.1 AGE family epimerase/isomerase [Bosea minatitlanensis]
MRDLSPSGLQRWTHGTLIPAWIERAHAREGGYVEEFAADGRPLAAPDRSALTTARLAYTFSHAARLSGDAAALEAARRGFDLLLKAQAANGHVPKRFLPDGAASVLRRDLYDLAFVLFACAHYHRATGEAAAIRLAEATMDGIETGLAAPFGGYAEDDRGTLPRRQNPHMHLLEAFHALAEATGSQRWFDAADRIVRLAAERFIDAGGTLGEFFDMNWQPVAGAAGRLREPGHQFEWVWLLHHHQRLTGWEPARRLADGLHRFGLAQGLDRDPGCPPLVLDGVETDGTPVAATKLLWPQTEFVKALGARFEFAGEAEAADRLTHHLGLIFAHFIDARTGLWRNQLDRAGAPLPVALPARVLYHLFLCLAETLRVLPPPSGPGGQAA